MNLSAIYWCIRKRFPLRSLLTCDLCYYKLPVSTTIPHPYGITVANGADIGEEVFISPNVTIGVKEIWFNRSWRTTSLAPIIGDRVFIGAGAVILGDITIIDDCVIGAGSVVVDSFLEPGSVIAGSPGKEDKMNFTKDTVVTVIAHTKVIIFYGAESVYPFFTLFTAVGIAKIAFGIPTFWAIAIMVGIIAAVGITTFKVGVFGKDLDIKWNNTPSAKKLCEQVDQLCREGKE